MISIFRLMRAKNFMITVFVSGFFLVGIISVLRSFSDNSDRGLTLQQIDQFIHQKSSNLACKHPNLPVNSPEMMKFVHESPRIDCSLAGKDWVKCEGYSCRIPEQIKMLYGPVKCSFTELIRTDDFSWSKGETTNSDSYYKLLKSDVVSVSCWSQSNKWSSTLTGIRIEKLIWEHSQWDKVPNTAAKVNVLMFGLDSISRNNFVRKLPRSYEYLIKELGGSILEGYNIVGDGTPQALIPILTGKTELELPDTRKRISNTKFVNSYPFIWNDYKDAGYVTGYFEDTPDTGIFTYRLNGFDKPPTDHYMRPYYLASSGETHKWPKWCSGEIPRHKVMLNQIKGFFSVYEKKPKFLFGFHGELSHDDYNLVGAADDDLYEFLRDLKESGALNNTVLILMSDHGQRFAEVRNTIQGKQEERLPFFSFTFPETFKRHFKVAYKNFKSNLNKLTTPFDIHATLRSLLYFDDIGTADISKRSVSLFTKIPAERSCAHAYIEPHWCACLDWEEVPLSSPMVNRVAETLVSTLNEYTEPHRNLCEVLKVHEIHWLTKMAPNENLIKFNKNKDNDGFVPDLSAKMDIKTDTYQIKVSMMPGESIFEASVTHSKDADKLDVRISDISRTNKYGNQARCVVNEFPHLRKYCYCKD